MELKKERERASKRDQNMVLNLLRYHHRDKVIYVLVTVYSKQYRMDEVRWGPLKRVYLTQFCWWRTWTPASSWYTDGDTSFLIPNIGKLTLKANRGSHTILLVKDIHQRLQIHRYSPWVVVQLCKFSEKCPCVWTKIRISFN